MANRTGVVTAKRRLKRRMIHLAVPLELGEKIRQRAEETSVPVSTAARQLIVIGLAAAA